jgi:hypothetical protein
VSLSVSRKRNKLAQYLAAAFVLTACSSYTANAQQKKTTPAPAPKAAPAKPAAGAAKPAGASTAGHTTTTTANHGATTGAKTTTTTSSRTTTTAGGHTTTTTTSRTTTTASAGRAPAGSHETRTANGSVVRTRANGQRSDIHDARRGMDIHHGLDGGRRVSVERRDGSRLVAERGRPGYVQRGYSYHGHDYARRSYYYNGRQYDRYYRGYGYRGLALNVYAPGVYFAPGFYGWAYNPWAVPIAYGWGWAGNPWLGFYGGFFSPWAVYPSAAFWLTDYLIAANLQAAYAAQAGLVSDAGGGSLQITENENSPDLPAGSPNWTFNGNHGVGAFGTGNQPMTIESFSNGNIAVRRVDTTGDWHGSALYVGHIDGNMVSGQVTYFDPGGGRRLGTWHGTIQGSALDSPGAPPAGDTAGAAPLSPEVKQLIADEVKSQLALENVEATQTAQNQDVDPGSSGIARMLADGHPHMFVAGGSLDVTDASSGKECHISDGDALQLQTPPAQDATAANLVVKASKGGAECAPGSTVAVNLTDLQEMQNHMRENIDVGLKDLQAKQGKGGLPQAPPSAQTAPTQTQYAAIAPPPNPQDAADIQEQNKQADQAEQEVASAAPPASGPSDPGTPAPVAPPPPPSGPPPTIALGQTIDQVTAGMGAPTRVIDLGTKKIYVYKDMKVTFKAGKVSDVE